MSKYTVKEFIAQLRMGAYTSVGCYPIFFITADGGILSFNAAKNNALLIGQAIQSGSDKQWEVIEAEVNWEDNDLYCDHTDDPIECAYGNKTTEDDPDNVDDSDIQNR